MATVSAGEIRQALDAADFPLDKQALVSAAEDGGAGQEVVRALRSLPLATYQNVDEVVRSLDTVEAAGQTPSEKGAQARDHDAPGLAEHMRSRER